MYYDYSMPSSIAVIGQGFVGGSLSSVFAEKGLDVYTYDKAGKLATGAKPGKLDGSFATSVLELVDACEKRPGFKKIYFVCLPTPMRPDGVADLSLVEGTLRNLAELPGERIAVIKSTVPPGSTESWNKKFETSGLRVVFNPEFLTEANALQDCRNQTRIILGGPRPYINKVKQLYQSTFPKVPIIKTSSTTAEMIKYVTNCFLATKISFANEIYQICGALDKSGLNVDYDKVVEYARYDERLGNSHWSVPSFESDEDGNPLFGFGLSCFPKDLNALRKVAEGLGVDPKMLKATWQKNLEVRPSKDWEQLKGRAVSNDQ